MRVQASVNVKLLSGLLGCVQMNRSPEECEYAQTLIISNRSKPTRTSVEAAAAPASRPGVSERSSMTGSNKRPLPSSSATRWLFRIRAAGLGLEPTLVPLRSCISANII